MLVHLYIVRLQQQSWVVATETTWSAKPTMFTSWYFRQSLLAPALRPSWRFTNHSSTLDWDSKKSSSKEIHSILFSKGFHKHIWFNKIKLFSPCYRHQFLSKDVFHTHSGKNWGGGVWVRGWGVCARRRHSNTTITGERVHTCLQTLLVYQAVDTRTLSKWFFNQLLRWI